METEKNLTLSQLSSACYRSKSGEFVRTFMVYCILLTMGVVPVYAKHAKSTAPISKVVATDNAQLKQENIPEKIVFPKKTTMLIARPSCISTSKKGDDKWFAALCETYFHIRIGSLKNVDVVASDSLFQYVPKYRDFSQEPLPIDYSILFSRFQVMYALFPKYELMSGGKEFSFYVEILRISDNKSLLAFEKMGTVENMDKVFDSCIVCLQKDLHILMPEQITGSFKVSLLGDNGKNLLKNYKLAGMSIFSEMYAKTENPLKAVKVLKVLPGLISSYSCALAYYRANDFSNAAPLFATVAKSVPDFSSVFPPLCKSYRMDQKPDDALTYVFMAEAAEINSLELLREKALDYQAKADLKKTADVYATILSIDATDASALRFLAWQNNEDNNAPQALHFADRLLGAMPQDGKGLLEKGRSLWILKKYDAASDALKAAAPRLPDDPLPILYLGDVYRQTGNFPGAAMAYEKAMAMMPSDPYVCLKAAEVQTLAGNQKGALSLLKKIEYKFPQNSMVLKKLGLLEFQLSDRDHAMKHLEEFCKNQENDAQVNLTLASLYTESKNIDKALDLYSKALPVTEDKNSCDMEMAKLYLTKTDAEKALVHLTSIVARNPNYAQVNNYLGQAYEMAGEKKKALACYQKDQKVTGKTSAQTKLGALNFELGNLQDAEREYMQLIKTDTTNSEAFFRLALINFKKGKIDKADGFCAAGARFGSANADLYFQIAQGYMNSGNTSKAIDYYSKSVALSGKELTVWQQLAQALLKDQRDSLAAEACLKVFEFDHRMYKDYLVQSALCFNKIGIEARAKALFNQFLDEGFINGEVNEILAGIEFKNKNFKRVIDLQKDIPDDAPQQSVLNLAESYCAQGQFDNALPKLSLVLDKNPTNRKALELSAFAHEKLGDDKNALAIQKKLVSLSSGVGKQKDYAFHVGQLLENQDQKEKAVKSYEKNIVDFPDDIRNFERAAALYMADKNWNRAQVLLEKALPLTGATPLLQKMLAQSFAAQGTRISAIAQYKSYLSIVPADSMAWNELGSVYYEQEHFAAAKDALLKAVAFMPKNVDCLTLLASCFIKLSQPLEAISFLEKAHAINKNNIQIMANLASCYRSSQDTKKQTVLLQEWLNVEPKNLSVIKECAELLYGEQKIHEAVTLLENACSLDSTDARVHFLLAKGYDKLGKQSAHFEHLEKATRYDPKSGEIQFEMGKFYNSIKQFSKALPYLLKAISLDTLNACAHYEYSCLLRAQKNFSQAFDEANRAAQYEPYNTTFLMLQIQTAYLCGKKEMAFEIIKPLYVKNKNSLEIVQWAGLLYKECGSPDSAKQILEKALSLSSSCASCYKNLGDLYRSDGCYEKAIKLYGQALAVGTFEEGTALGLGQAYLAIGDFSRARQMFEKALQENQKSDEALFWNCSVYLKVDKKDNAKALFSNLALGRKSGWIHCIQGEIYEADGRSDEALISFTVASTLMPENPIAYSGAGRINLLKQQYDRAIENFGKALARDQQCVQYLLLLGRAYEGLGQNEAALNLYLDVASKAPKDNDVYSLLARVYSKKQNHQKAVDALKTGLTYYPKNPQLFYALAHEYRLLTQINDAVDAYKKAIKNSKEEFADAYRDLGDLYNYELKDTKEAKKFYQKYMKSGGKDDKVVQFVNSMGN